MADSGYCFIALCLIASLCVTLPMTGFAKHVEQEDDTVADPLRSSNGAVDALTVYVVPHSHMDVGWVYTVEESMHAYAANVYTTVIAELANNPARRFIAVEQEFFRLWWNGVATEQEKNQTRKFVSSGQFEFIIGGQVMHDEAVTELSAIIQQMTEGHAFIYETFGVRPRFGWHVDPFGASAATPTLFALMGFNAHLTSRIDYDTKAEMMKNKGLQFVWQASPSLGSAQSMFTHVMDMYSYCAPGEIPPFSNRSGYMWNGVAKFPDPPVDGIYPNMSDPVTKQNIAQYADFMVANIRQRAAWFKSPYLLWPWGCDKQFFNATVQFKNMDFLLEHINQQSPKYGIKIRYATLGEFFTVLYSNNTAWDVKTKGDFLPYSSAREEAWTGFYTSRIELKGQARASQAALRAGESLFTVYTHLYNVSRLINTTGALEKLKQLRWATAEVQHHDGITGTESPKVRDMYSSHLHDASKATLKVVTEILSELTRVNGRPLLSPIKELRQEKKAVPIAVYNSLGWTVRRVIQVDVESPNVTILDSKGQLVQSQIDLPSKPNEPYRLFFFAVLPPVGYELFMLLYFDTTMPNAVQSTVMTYDADAAKWKRNAMDEDSQTDGEDIMIENECYQVMFDGATNILSSIKDKRTGKVTAMAAKFLEYNVYHNVLYGQASNNYIFRPYGQANGINSFRVKLDVVTGILVNETRQHFYGLFDNTSRYSVITRLVSDPSGHSDNISCGHIELDFKVGPLSMNKELVYRFSTPLSSNGNLYADVNAYQTMNRSRRHGANYIARNMFPMVSSAYIEDTDADMRLMLLSDRSHGVSSQRNGDLEVMLHRRLVNNEFNNYNLTLKDPSVASSSFWLLLGNRSVTSELRHRSWLQLENTPVTSRVGPGWSSREEVDWAALRRSQRRFRSALSTDLPPNVHLLTFKTPGWVFKDSADHQDTEGPEGTAPNLERILLRLQHLYEVGEHPILSKPVTLDLQTMLSPLGTIKVAEERSLSTVWNMHDLTRWKWRTKDTIGSSDARSTSSDAPLTQQAASSDSSDSLKVTLKPQEIKTFFVTMQIPST